MLAQFGIVVPKGTSTFKDQWHRLRIEHSDRVPDLAWTTLDKLYVQLKTIHQRVLACDRQISQFIREDERARRLTQINSIGPVTASAIVATVGNGHDFRNGRQFAAWLGLTPRQYSTGGVTKLGRISKRGDVYLRTLLVHGARSELIHTARRSDRKSRWVEELTKTKSFNQSAVALANKHARIAWSVLAHEQDYQPA